MTETCGMTLASCKCSKAPHKVTEPHLCQEDCGGMWIDDAEGTFGIIRYPKTDYIFDPPLQDTPNDRDRFKEAVRAGKIPLPESAFD